VAPLLLALAIGAAALEHARLVLSVAAGGGWASDAFAGAGLGGGPVLDVAPGARLDLSLSPSVKAAFGAELSSLHFTSADFHTLAGRAGAEVRLLRRRTDLSLALAGERAEYSRAVPFGELVGSPQVTSTTAVVLTPGIALRRASVRVRAGLAATLRASQADAQVAERGLALEGGVDWDAAPEVTVHAAVRGDRVFSGREDFARSMAGAEAGLAVAPVDGVALALGLRAGLDRVRFENGLDEKLARAGVDLTYPFGPVSAVLAWSWTWSDPDVGPGAGRHLVYAGVRAREATLSW
jgi:hypothetical protein